MIVVTNAFIVRIDAKVGGYAAQKKKKIQRTSQTD